MQIILGSQSPRRRDLLGGLVPSSQLQVLPPQSPEEPGFDELGTAVEIADRLRSIVRLKRADVTRQIAVQQNACLICADTIVVATRADGTCC